MIRPGLVLLVSSIGLVTSVPARAFQQGEVVASELVLEAMQKLCESWDHGGYSDLPDPEDPPRHTLFPPWSAAQVVKNAQAIGKACRSLGAAAGGGGLSQMLLEIGAELEAVRADGTGDDRYWRIRASEVRLRIHGAAARISAAPTANSASSQAYRRQLATRSPFVAPASAMPCQPGSISSQTPIGRSNRPSFSHGLSAAGACRSTQFIRAASGRTVSGADLAMRGH